MEGMFLQSVPMKGSLVEGVLLFALVVLAVLYGRFHKGASQETHSR
jgi:hypothetical protein